MIKYDLGDKVYCFKSHNDEITAYYGFIRAVQINSGGVRQYDIDCLQGDNIVTIAANEQTMDATEDGLKAKIEKFKQYLLESDELAEKFFGVSEFSISELRDSLKGGNNGK